MSATNPVYPSLYPEIGRHACLGSGHFRLEDIDLLCKDSPNQPLVAHTLEHGGVVLRNLGLALELLGEWPDFGYSDDLVALIENLVGDGIDLLWIDPDGPVSDALPVFEHS